VHDHPLRVRFSKLIFLSVLALLIAWLRIFGGALEKA
jgi:hypothetical protein